MRILELTDYSAGICGVFARVRQEAVLLSKLGNEVRIFSSDIEKGTNKQVSNEDCVDNVKISRFSAKKLGGESFMSWNFEEEALKFKPEVIIVHSYRHPHTTKALLIARKIGAKIFLVTHAPFERSDTRSFLANILVWFYDNIIGRKTLKQFDKVIAITHWEIPYLEKLGVSGKKIVYIPNGIPDEFFSIKKEQEKNKILYLGRISPIKNLETLIAAMELIGDKKRILEIVGPAEKEYLEKLKEIIKQKNLESRVKFLPAIYDLKQKIKRLDSAKIFVLPSKSEGMPQSLIEAMARGKIVIASDNSGSKDLIRDGKNGYLFKIGDEEQLAKKINLALSGNRTKLKKEAEKTMRMFAWSLILKKLEKTISS